jgi:iron complex outermembrane receptor protein
VSGRFNGYVFMKSILFLFSHSSGLRLGALLALVAPPSVIASPSGAKASDHETVNLEHVVVTALPFQRSQTDIAAATAVLGGRQLTLRRQGTLGETLSGELGMSSTAFGPGAGRPIIRGLGGDRIRLLENGVGTMDASVVSPDHAVSVEPFLVDRVEIVRGPASLLYGSSAVGGVVNVISHRIEREVPESRVSGTSEFRLGSGANERETGGWVDVALTRTADQALILHLDAFRRTAGDLEIPGFAESEALRAEEAEEAEEAGVEPPDEIAGVIPNTAVEAKGGAAGLSWVSPTLRVGLVRSGFETFYGIPAGAHAHHGHEEHDEEHEEEEHAEEEHGEEDVRIDLRQRRWDLQGDWSGGKGLITGLRFKWGQADYRHVELEGDEVGTTFQNEAYEFRVEALHAPLAGFEGAWGAQASRSDFTAEGAEAFLPPTVTEQRALFLFEEYKAGAVTAQAGVRLENQRVRNEDTKRKRNDDALSASVGLIWPWSTDNSLALSLSRTERAPNAQELFADGAHAGTQTYEIGDPNLDAETSNGIELSLRRREGFVTGVASVYLNRFQGYIDEVATGEEKDELPVYRFTQSKAEFRGAELEAIFHLHEGQKHRLDFRLAGDLTRAEGRGGAPLPRIPAAKALAGLDWSAGGLAAGASVQRVARQGRVTDQETPTAGYTWIEAYAMYRATVGATTLDLFVSGRNLADEEARMHTSFLKDVAPRVGRSWTAGVRLAF